MAFAWQWQLILADNVSTAGGQLCHFQQQDQLPVALVV